jgi:hypothetical protein
MYGKRALGVQVREHAEKVQQNATAIRNIERDIVQIHEVCLTVFQYSCMIIIIIIIIVIMIMIIITQQCRDRQTMHESASSTVFPRFGLFGQRATSRNR